MPSRYLLVAGAVLTLLGLIMIPLPGPGLPVVSLGVAVLLAGVLVAAVQRSRKQSPP